MFLGVELTMDVLNRFQVGELGEGVILSNLEVVPVAALILPGLLSC